MIFLLSVSRSRWKLRVASWYLFNRLSNICEVLDGFAVVVVMVGGGQIQQMFRFFLSGNVTACNGAINHWHTNLSAFPFHRLA